MSDLSASIDQVSITACDVAVLEMEDRFYRYAGAKEQAVHDELGMSMPRYSQRLLTLLEDPDAYRARPVLVKRLRRMRDQKRTARAVARRALT